MSLDPERRRWYRELYDRIRGLGAEAAAGTKAPRRPVAVADGVVDLKGFIALDVGEVGVMQFPDRPPAISLLMGSGELDRPLLALIDPAAMPHLVATLMRAGARARALAQAAESPPDPAGSRSETEGGGP